MWLSWKKNNRIYTWKKSNQKWLLLLKTVKTSRNGGELWEEEATIHLKIPPLALQVCTFKGSSSLIFDNILQSKADIFSYLERWHPTIHYSSILYHRIHIMSREITNDILCKTIKNLIESKYLDIVSQNSSSAIFKWPLSKRLDLKEFQSTFEKRAGVFWPKNILAWA